MKRGFSVSTLLSLVTGTLVAVLVTATLVSATSAFKRERDSAQIMSNARVTRDVVMVREALRAEWGVMDTTVRDPVIASPQSLAKLKILHKKTLAAIGYFEQEIAQSENEKLPPELAARFKRLA